MRTVVFIVISLVAGSAVSCSRQETRAPENTAQNTNLASAPSQPPQSQPDRQAAKPKRPPAKGVTAADIAKLSWLEGSWRGTGAPKPFYNRYHFDGTILKITGFDDEAMTKQVDAARYELKDGMFANPDGENRFAASEITDSYVQFVTLTGTTQAFRMERQDDGNVKATLEWTGPDGKTEEKAYILEPLKK